MSWLEAIILGIVQGLTEFLPVSSSGHLELAKMILGQDAVGDESMLMTVTLHGATALSTLVIFRKDILEIIRGLFSADKTQVAFAGKIILSMIPAAFIGLVYNDAIGALFDGNILLVGAMLLLTGALLFLADRAKDTDKEVGFGHALIIGISQAIAILPGISRSGATISTSVLLGIDRSRAARFSFLMVVPLIFGKMAKDILDGAFVNPDIAVAPIAIGFIAAFLTGLLACTWMIALVKKAELRWFAFYCLAVGVAAIIWSVT